MHSFHMQPTNSNSISPAPALSHYNLIITKNASITSAANKSSKASRITEIAEPIKRDRRLERILNKFRSGQKLSPDELSYVAQKAPEMYQKIVNIIRRREQLEKRLASATKEGAAQIMSQEMGSIESIPDGFEKEATANQLREAFNGYLATRSPDTEEDEDELEEAGIPSNKKKRHFINIQV